MESSVIDPVEEFQAVLSKAQIPKNLKDLLSYCGWNSISTFQNILESDIDEMERFARDDLSQLLEGTELKEFFGIFAKKPSLFRIQGGHRQMLYKVKEMCSTHFQKEVCKCKCTCKVKASETTGKKKVNSLKSIGKRRHDTDEQGTEGVTEPENDKNNRNEPVLSEKGPEESLNHLTLIIGNYIKSFCNKTLKDIDGANIKSKMDNIQLSADSPTSAKIKCLLCDANIKVSRVEGKYGKKWVTSNFNYHFKNHFKEKTERNKLKNSSLLDYFHGYRENGVIDQSESSSLDTNFDSNGTCTQMSAEETNLETGIYMDSNNEVDNNLSNSISVIQSGLALEVPQELSVLESNTFFLQSRTSHEAGSAAPEMKLETVPQNHTRESKWKDNKYSRTQRNLRKLEKVDHQLKITSFFEIKDRIVEVLKTNENAEKDLLKSCSEHYELAEPGAKLNMNNFFNILIKHAKQNNTTTGKSNRFSEELRKFCLFLFIIGGKLTYETLHKNLQNIMPSLSSVRRTLNENLSVTEGVVCMYELKNYLLKRKLPLSVFISEDQTAILRKIQYDPKSNKLVGVLLPKDKNSGFPITDKFVVTSIRDIKNAFENETISNNAYVFMAQPLKDKVPAFCLCIFGSNNKFSYEDVYKRWSFLMDEARKFGIDIHGISSDGDTRCLKAMKKHSNFPDKSDKNVLSPYFQVSLSW